MVFDHIARPAQAFVAALAAREFLCRGRDAHVWILADDLRAQERLADGLRIWYGETLFLPELEIASIH